MADLIEMLQFVLSRTDPYLANETRRIILKEALQVYVLDFLYNHPLYRNLNFYGGTCLHIVYGLNRLSEDLDLDNTNHIQLNHLPEDLIANFSHVFGFSAMTVKSQMGSSGILRITMRFPILNQIGLSTHPNEALHLKLEISHHPQIAVIRKTPVFLHGRSFVPAHFSLETMMAGKILACLERSFQRGRAGSSIKGRDFYDLLWLMQKNIRPLEEKLSREGNQPYTTASAMQALIEKVRGIRTADLAVDLLPLFEQRVFIESWLEGFHQNFLELARGYLE